MAMLVALAQGDNDCKNAVSRGIVGRPCGNDIVTVKDHRRLGLPKTAALKCNVDGKCVNDAIYVTLGNGCFWERQYAYTHVEMEKFHRKRSQVSAVVGYTGAMQAGPHGEVCYHSSSPVDYSTLGFFETVQVKVDNVHKEAQFTALAKDFFSSFSWDANRKGMRRPDDWSTFSGDHGKAYRSGIGIPGGIKGSLYKIIKQENAKLDHPMKLVAGVGQDPDVFNTVYIMDSDKFKFFVGEAYHQFHSNFFGPSYEAPYLAMNAAFRKTKHIAHSPGCSDYRRRLLRGGARGADPMRTYLDS